MRLHPTAPLQQTNNRTLSTERRRRRRKASCGAASLIATAAASALVLFLALSSISRRREMNTVAEFRPNAKGVPPPQRPSDIENTIGEHADSTNNDNDTSTEQTQQHPRRRRRRLEDTGEEIDEEMDQHRGHHHDEGDEEYTDELSLSENDKESAGENIEPKGTLNDSDSNDDQDKGITPPWPGLYNPEPKPESSQLELSTVVESITEEEQIFQIQEIAERLRPRPMLSFDANVTKQFAHLHHMKTGGTSINHLLNCALGRARTLYQQTQTQPDAGTAAGGSSRRGRVLPFYSLEECSHSHYLTCIGNDNSTSAQSCRSNIASASVMQYCAPLHQMARFEWLDADIVSVIRHPVDRVWSMFRFQTKSCFQCTPLLDIYRHIEEGTLDEFCGEKGCGGGCTPQLLNHETRNLLTDTWDENDAGGVSLSTDEEKLQEALFNLKSRVTLVGVTDELPVFAEMLGKVFPWLAESVTAEELGMAIVGDNGAARRAKLRRAATSTETTEPKTCPLTHANASPKNNRCAPGNKHWELPDEPDEETREAILRHNQLDLKIYEAAKARFQLQKQALGLH